MHILLKVVITFVLIMGLAWAFLPGGMGLSNFKAIHAQLLNIIGTAFWVMLLLAHPFVLYKIWAGSEAHVYWWLLLPVTMHIVFFAIFGQNVSARG